MSLASLSRVVQICKLILREHFLMNEIIHKDVDLDKNMSIKIQKFFPEIGNKMIFYEQK
jgi:hypothetical protein